MTASTPNLDQIDAALRLLDRELWIVTAASGDRRGGLLATWVSVASIDPQRPVLVAGLAPNHFTTELVQAGNSFAAHLLRPDQFNLAYNFAHDSGRTRDKFVGLEVQFHETSSPLLTDCLAWFDCRVYARHSTGDRLYFWANVVGTLRVPSNELPLREHSFFNALTPHQRQTLAANREADILANRSRLPPGT